MCVCVCFVVYHSTSVEQFWQVSSVHCHVSSRVDTVSAMCAGLRGLWAPSPKWCARVGLGSPRNCGSLVINISVFNRFSLVQLTLAFSFAQNKVQLWRALVTQGFGELGRPDLCWMCRDLGDALKEQLNTGQVCPARSAERNQKNMVGSLQLFRGVSLCCFKYIYTPLSY